MLAKQSGLAYFTRRLQQARQTTYAGTSILATMKN